MIECLEKILPLVIPLLKGIALIIEQLTDWSFLIFLLLIIFRKRLVGVIPALLIKLTERVGSVSGFGVVVSFNDLKERI